MYLAIIDVKPLDDYKLELTFENNEKRLFDMKPELVLWLKVNENNYYGFEILRQQDEEVFAYTLSYRSFMDLKEDGTFSFSSGAADYGYGRIKFTDEGYTVDKIAYSESDYDSNSDQVISYFVNYESATEEEFISAIDKQSEKKKVTWYDFSDDNIERVLD